MIEIGVGVVRMASSRKPAEASSSSCSAAVRSSQDESGLFLVGSLMLGIGLTAGTIVAAATGRGLQSALDGVRRRRATGGREPDDS